MKCNQNRFSRASVSFLGLAFSRDSNAPEKPKTTRFSGGEVDTPSGDTDDKTGHSLKHRYSVRICQWDWEHRLAMSLRDPHIGCKFGGSMFHSYIVQESISGPWMLTERCRSASKLRQQWPWFLHVICIKHINWKHNRQTTGIPSEHTVFKSLTSRRN
jgi:hypothetical protein